MKVGELYAELSLRISKFSQGLKAAFQAVEREAKRMSEVFSSALAGAAKDLGSAVISETKPLTKMMGQIVDGFRGLKLRVELDSSRLDGATTSTQNLAKALNDARQAAGRLVSILQGLEGAGRTTGEIEKVIASLRKLHGALAATGKQAEKISPTLALEPLTAGVAEITTAVGGLAEKAVQAAVGRITTALEKLQAATREFKIKIDIDTTSIMGVTSKLREMAKELGKAKARADLLAKALKLLAAVPTAATPLDPEELSQKLKFEGSIKLKEELTEIINLLSAVKKAPDTDLKFVSSGVTLRDVFQYLEGIKEATAGFDKLLSYLDKASLVFRATTENAQALAATLSKFDELSIMAEAADIIHDSLAQASSKAEELNQALAGTAESFKQIVASSNAVGVMHETLEEAVMYLKDVTIPALKEISSGFSGEMNKLGADLDRASSKLRSFKYTAEQLKTYAKDKLAGAMGSVSAIVLGIAEKYREIFAQTTAHVASLEQSSRDTAGAFETNLGRIGSALMKLKDEALPAFSEVVQNLDFRTFKRVFESLPMIPLRIGDLIDKSIKLSQVNFDHIRKTFDGLVEGYPERFDALTSAVEKLGDVRVGGATRSLRTLSEVAGAVAAELTPAVSGIAGILSIFENARSFFATSGTAAETLAISLSNMLTLKEGLERLVITLRRLGNTKFTALINALEPLASKVTSVVAVINDAIQNIPRNLYGAAEGISTGMEMISGELNLLAMAFEDTFSRISDVASRGFGYYPKGLAADFPEINTLITSLQEKFSLLAAELGEQFAQIVIKAAGALENIKPAVDEIAAYILTAFERVFQRVAESTEKMAPSLKAGLSAAVAGINSEIRKIKTAVDSVSKRLDTHFKEGLLKLKPVISEVASFFRDQFREAINATAREIQSIAAAMQGLVEATTTSVEAALGILASRTQEIIAGMMAGATEAMASPAPTAAVVEAMREVGTASREMASNVREDARAAGDELAENLGDRPRKEIKKTGKAVARTTWTVRGYLKDTSRVVTGILISQTFYKILRAIRDVTAEVWNLTMVLEQAAISFKYLIGDASAAQGLIQVLETFAVKTPYGFEESVKSARALLAAGFSLRDVVPIMHRLTDAAAATGAAFEDVVHIIALIHSRGRLMGQEVKMLQTLNINILKILREQLKLTDAQVGAIGRLGIPADIAIKAILAGFKDFEGAAEEMSRTIDGLKSNIKDNLLAIVHQAIEPLIEGIRSAFERIEKWLDHIRTGMRQFGRGFLISIFPPELHQAIRIIAASLHSLWASIKKLAEVVLIAGRYVVHYFGHALSIILPLLAGVVHDIADLIHWLVTSFPVIRFFASALMGLSVVSFVTVLIIKLVTAIKWLWAAIGAAKAIAYLTNAVAFLGATLTSHPVIALITLLAAALVGLAISFKSVRSWLGRVMGGFVDLLGFKTADMFKIEEVEDYSKALKDASEGMEQLKEETEGAKNAFKKFLASFDEVYTLPEETDKSFKDVWPDFDLDLTMPELPTVEMPEIEAAGASWGSLVDDWLNGVRIIKTWFKNVVDNWLNGVRLIGEWWGRLVDNWLNGVNIIKKWWRKLIDDWLNGVALIKQWFKDMWTSIADFCTNTYNNIIKWAKDTWKIIVDFWSDLYGSVVGWLKDLWTEISTFWVDLYEDAKTWLADSWKIVSKFWTDLYDDAKRWLKDIWAQLAGWWRETYTGIKGWLADAWASIVNWWSELKLKLRTWLSDTWAPIATWWGNLVGGIKTWLDSILTKVETAWGNIVGTIKGYINIIIGYINQLLDLWNKVSFEVPEIKLGNKVLYEGGKVGLPQIGHIKKLAAGGIVKKDALIRAGERRPEAIVPLEGEYARPFAQMLAREFTAAAAAAGGGGGEPQPIMYVGTLIASDQSLRELERRMRIVRLKEDRRTGQ